MHRGLKITSNIGGELALWTVTECHQQCICDGAFQKARESPADFLGKPIGTWGAGPQTGAAVHAGRVQRLLPAGMSLT